MSTTFRDARRRLQWAKKDFEQFRRSARRFFNSDPHRAFVELDADGVNEIHKITLSKPLPDILESRVVSILENLRHSLDLAAYTVAECANVATDRIYFPFSAKAVDFKSRLKSACKGFPLEIQALFESFEPYEGGDDLLWALNEICNGSKHRIIAPFGMAMENTHFISTGGPVTMPLGGWDSDKEELVYLITPRGTHSKYKAKFSFDVTFRDVPVVKGQPVVAVLDMLIVKVEHILNSTETVCRRIRLL